MTIDPTLIWISVFVAVALVVFWKRRTINQWLSTWKADKATIDAKVIKIEASRTTPSPAPAASPAIASAPAHPSQGASGTMPPSLPDLITRYFSLEEVRTLCFDLDVDYASLLGEGHAAKNRELVIHMKRDGRYQELVDYCADKRPHVDWSRALSSPMAAPASSQIRVRQDASDGGIIRGSGISAPKEAAASIEQDAHKKGTIEDSPVNIS